MNKEHQERADHLRELRGYLESVLSNTQTAAKAPSMFSKLLMIDRWLQQELLPLTPRHDRLPIPAEVVPAKYRLHGQDEITSEVVIPAEIVGLGSRQCAMTIFARFPEHAELQGENEFIVGFEDDDQRFEIVEFQRVDSTTGAHLETPRGALAGLYIALLATCRDELDQWRINAAHLEDIELPPAAAA